MEYISHLPLVKTQESDKTHGEKKATEDDERLLWGHCKTIARRDVAVLPFLNDP